MKLKVQGIPTDEVDRIRRGEHDANGQPALLRMAEGLALLIRPLVRSSM